MFRYLIINLFRLHCHSMNAIVKVLKIILLKLETEFVKSYFFVGVFRFYYFSKI